MFVLYVFFLFFFTIAGLPSGNCRGWKVNKTFTSHPQVSFLLSISALCMLLLFQKVKICQSLMCSGEMLSCLCQAIGQAEGLAPLERICLFSHGGQKTKLHITKQKRKNGKLKSQIQLIITDPVLKLDSRWYKEEKQVMKHFTNLDKYKHTRGTICCSIFVTGCFLY